MKTSEQKMILILNDLKENHNVVCVKSEFEEEGTSLEETIRINSFAQKSGLSLTVKIGGCAAIRDLCDIKEIGINSIVAPMIETPYALKKYINAINQTFSETEKKQLKLFANIETITGFKNLAEIQSLEEYKLLTGIVIGRADLCASLGLQKNDVNSKQIFNITEEISKTQKANKKEMIIGGSLDIDSFDFLKQLSYLTKFETRKIVFSSSELNNPDYNAGILKALYFESLWLKNKLKNSNVVNSKDEKRLNKFEEKYKNQFKELENLYD